MFSYVNSITLTKPYALIVSLFVQFMVRPTSMQKIFGGPDRVIYTTAQ